MRFKLGWFVLLWLTACSDKKEFEAVAVYGHAGMGLRIENSVYHANSKESIELALAISGCDGVEVDVQLSADGELWLYHDKTLNNESTGSGCINDQSSATLSSLSYKTLQKEKVVRLVDLDVGLFKGKTLFLDIRHQNACQNLFVSPQTVIEQIQSSAIGQSSAIQIYCVLANPNWIQLFTAAGLQVIYSTDGTKFTTQVFSTYPGLDGVMVKNAAIDGDLIKEIRQLNKKVFIFEMRSPKGIRTALRKKPDGVITDDIRTTLIEKY
jgi:glycerophosphoryl diester phosphodiesterase